MNKLISLLILVFIAIVSKSYGQNYSPTKIDSLLEVIKKYGDSVPTLAISKAEQSFEYSKAIGYKKGMVSSSILISKNLFDTNQYDLALEQLLKIESIALKINDAVVLSEIYRLKGISYVSLGLFSQSFSEFQKAFIFANQIIDKDSGYKQKGLLYMDLAVAYDRSGKKIDVVLKYFKRSYKLFNEIKEIKARRINLSLASANLGACFLEMKQYDSASVYLRSAIRLSELENYNSTKLYAYLDLGEVRLEQNSYIDAIDYFEKALITARKLKKPALISTAYLKLYRTYEKIGDHKMEEFYYTQYEELNDSLQKFKKNAALKTVKKLLIEKDSKDFTIKKTWRIVLFIFAAITFVLVFWTTRIYLIKKSEKLFVAQKRRKLTEKKIMLDKAGKIDLIVVDYVALAKISNEHFLEAFRSNNSEFYNNFVNTFPNLNRFEIEICIFLRLGFRVKEIALHTDVTIRSVEARLYRIKKKVDLPLKEDISLWILNF